MTAAHNAVRARQTNPTPSPALPPMVWSASLAMTAQAYANKLSSDNCAFMHSGAKGLGENLAFYGGQMATPQQVVESWAGEQQCYSFGSKFGVGDKCDMTCAANMSSNGCGHYTQLVWRNSTELGCGVANCSGTPPREIWVCNYTPQGNFVNMPVF